MEIALITVSDRCSAGIYEDVTGTKMEEYLLSKNHRVTRDLVSDDMPQISDKLIFYSKKNYDCILTCGGTGCAPRDVTPEATKSVIEKEIPGLSELMRFENSKNHKHSYISRGTSGILKKTIIINLPGSPNGAVNNYSIIEDLLNHANLLIKQQINDCNK